MAEESASTYYRIFGVTPIHMQTQSTLFRELVVIRHLLVFFAALIVGMSHAYPGEVKVKLTGIVKQPVSYAPAEDCTVTVFERDSQTQIAGPDTTDATG